LVEILIPGHFGEAEDKGSMILRLVGRDQGATLAETMTAMGWLPHSLRPFKLSQQGSVVTSI
jgi:hypothetical protein